MGLDVDRFEGDVNEGLLCCICKDVLEEPLQAPCEHAFCRECIRGWLVNESTCPEDRGSLFEFDLRPLHRYMRNDLARLRLKCRFAPQGCSEVLCMESRSSHEKNCHHAEVTCPYSACNLTMTRRELQEHVLLCHCSALSSLDTQRQEQTTNSNPSLSTRSDSNNKQLVLVEEFQSAMEVLRAEMTCKIEEQRKEMEARLNMQRGHMIQKETHLHSQIDTLKTDVRRLRDRLQTILAVEMDRRREMDRLAVERTELKRTVHRLQQQQSLRLQQQNKPRLFQQQHHQQQCQQQQLQKQKQSENNVCPRCCQEISKISHV